MDLEELKDLHKKAYLANQANREIAANDMSFYLITQWDDSLDDSVEAAYRGEFNILKKAGRQILADLASNPVQIDFTPNDLDRKDAAEILDGLYRKNTNNNASIEAFENAKTEAVICGVGAWRLCNELATNIVGEEKQKIEREPIYEANNTVFWDPNSKRLDKKDAMYVSVLKSFSEDGYKKLVKDLKGTKDEDIVITSFDVPEQQDMFSWRPKENNVFYVSEFYYRKKKKEKVYNLKDPFDQIISISEKQYKDVKDELKETGLSLESSYEINRWRVYKYVASGFEILEKTVIPGEHIPIIPCYGEHNFVNDLEHYEGITRLAKDPQRLRNFQFSYLADIVSRTPRKKLILFPEQVAGLEAYHGQSGVANNLPYILINSKDPSGKDLPEGILGETSPAEMPQALAASIELTRQAVEDVANPGLPQDIADPDLSGKAVLALQARLDMQSMIYQEHYKHAKRRDAEIYASMAKEVYDIPRKEVIELPDGTKKHIEIMQAVLDKKTGNPIFLNDLRNTEFDVYSKIGASYSSQKEQTVDRLEKMIMVMDPSDPIRRALQLKQLLLMDGVEFDDIREYANKELVKLGVKKPQTPEEQEILRATQQNAQQQDAAMVLAKAEELKGQADIMKETREGVEMQLQNENDKIDHFIDMYKAKTDRMGLLIDAEQTGVNVDKIRIETKGKFLDNELKFKELQEDKKHEDLSK
jgi:hypothetical protein